MENGGGDSAEKQRERAGQPPEVDVSRSSDLPSWPEPSSGWSRSGICTRRSRAPRRWRWPSAPSAAPASWSSAWFGILRSDDQRRYSPRVATTPAGWAGTSPDKVKQHEFPRLRYPYRLSRRGRGVRLAYLGVTRADPFSPTPARAASRCRDAARRHSARARRAAGRRSGRDGDGLSAGVAAGGSRGRHCSEAHARNGEGRCRGRASIFFTYYRLVPTGSDRRAQKREACA